MKRFLLKAAVCILAVTALILLVSETESISSLIATKAIGAALLIGAAGLFPKAYPEESKEQI